MLSTTTTGLCGHLDYLLAHHAAPFEGLMCSGRLREWVDAVDDGAERARGDLVGQIAEDGGVGVGAEGTDAAGTVHARRGDCGQGRRGQPDGGHAAALGQPASVAVQFRADGVEDDVEGADPLRCGGTVVEDLV